MKRRIFVGGLTNDNFKLPPEDSGLYFLKFGIKIGNDNPPIEEMFLGGLVKSKKSDGDGSIEEVHLYEPNNIVIADINWIKQNWHKIDNWLQDPDRGSYITDINYNTEDLK